VFFVIGTWNLFIVNLAGTPDRSWFSLPVAVWAMGLVIYGAWTA
jgi:NADH:ubiquinone oxidoreductase subunit 4 (subunit M)